VRWSVLALVVSAGCAFQVPGVGPGSSSTGGNDPAGSQDAATPAPLPVGDGAVPESTQIGAACDALKHPCPAPLTCDTKAGFVDVPGGYCTMDCTSTSCPTGSQCSISWGGVRVCIEDCPAAGCRPGYICCKNGWAAPGACLTPGLCPDG
jgi:hypothetical protein